MVTMNHVRLRLLGILRAEQRIEDATAAALREWLPTAQEAVFGNLTAAAIPEGVLSTVEKWEDVLSRSVLPTVEDVMVGRMLERMRETGVDSLLDPDEGGDLAAQVRTAIYTATDAEIVYAAPGLREWQGEYLATVENRLRRVPDSVFDLITDQIDISMGLGESEAEQAARIKNILKWSGEEDWPGRARAIARTEATGAYNQATAWAAEVTAAHTGEEYVLGWMSVMDSRTRPSHYYADGQVVPLGSPFIVGGHECKYPGDPALPAEERVNCRCVCVDMPRADNLPDGPIVHPVYGDSDHTPADARKEIKLRTERGETRARDRDAAGDTLLADATDKETPMDNLTPWAGVLAPLGKPTGDGRQFSADAAVSFREFPLPLLWQRQTSDGHDLAYTVGAIRRAYVDDGLLRGEGVLFDTPEAAEAIAQLREGVTRPSVDLADVVWRLVDASTGEEISEGEAWDADDDLDLLTEFTEFTVLAATLVAKPAFAEARIDLVDDDALVASIGSLADEEAEEALLAAAPTIAPARRDLFDDPGLSEPTSIRMADNGRIFGHLALWDTPHMGVGDARVVAPRSRTGYALFHISEVETTDGPLAVGKLTVGGGHADPRLGVQPTVEHYDNAGTAYALVRAGEDEHGIWVSGVPSPWATPEQIALGLSCPLSGDWRRHGGNLELVAALSVNTPGFPVPRGYSDGDGRDYALVAAGAVRPARPTLDLDDVTERVRDAVRLALREEREEIARREERLAAVERVRARIEEDRTRRARTLRASVLALRTRREVN